jgi:hypothetical protein
MKMESEYLHETFRSEVGTFDKNFADYLVGRREEDLHIKTCTFFRDVKEQKKWASCLFERRP